MIELLFPHCPLYSKTEIEMLGQLDMARHPAEVGLGLLLMMVVLTATAVAPAAADDIALVVGIGYALVVVFADLQVGKYFPWSLQP